MRGPWGSFDNVTECLPLGRGNTVNTDILYVWFFKAICRLRSCMIALRIG